MKKTIIVVAIILILAIGLSGCLFTVREDQYACTFRFSEIVNTTETPGLHFKMPFVDSVKYFSKATQFYDIPPSEVLTSDKQNTVPHRQPGHRERSRRSAESPAQSWCR